MIQKIVESEGSKFKGDKQGWTMPVPRKKVEEFVKEIKKAKSSEELLEIANKIETYFDIHGDTSVLPILIDLFIQLSKLEDAEFYIEALKKENHGLAKLFKAEIEKFKRNFTKAEQLLNKIINDETIEKDIKRDAFWMKISLLGGMLRYKEILEAFKQLGCSNLEEIKQFIIDEAPEEDFDTFINVFYCLQNWKKADDYFSRPEKQYTLEAVRKLISKYSRDYALSYSLESDWEYPVETLYVVVTFFHPMQREKIEELKRKLIEKTFFEMKEDVVFRIGEEIKGYETIRS